MKSQLSRIVKIAVAVAMVGGIAACAAAPGPAYSRPYYRQYYQPTPYRPYYPPSSPNGPLVGEG
jgi:hypothetical protein